MKKLIALFFSLFAISSCAVFTDEIDQVADKIGDGVDRYCSELNQADRMRVRGKVNPTPNGASVVVTCPGDS